MPTASATDHYVTALAVHNKWIFHRRWLKSGGDQRAFLLLCPNLTLVALAAKTMLEQGTDAKLAAWLVLTGSFMTITSLLMLLAGERAGPPNQAGLKSPAWRQTTLPRLQQPNRAGELRVSGSTRLPVYAGRRIEP